MPKAEDYIEENEFTSSNIEKEVFTIFQDLARRTQDAIQTLHTMISDWADKKESTLPAHLETIVTLEKEADDLKRQIFNTLSQATTHLQREDMMKIVVVVDQITDEIEGCAHVLITLTEFPTPAPVRKQIESLLEPVNHIVRETRELIRILPINLKTTFDISQHVDDIEREIDTLHRKTRTYILKTIEAPAILYLAVDLSERLESIADLCEDAADAIRIFVVARVR